MTSFDVFESSRESSRPIEVYRFAMGVESFLYTSRALEVVLGGDTYAPIAIARNNIEQGSDQRNRNVIVTVPSNNPFARKYVNVVPGEKATLSIIRLQPDETPTFNTQALLFKGQVQSVRFPQDGHTAEIVVRSIEAAKSQNIPRFTYMGLCNHFLYDAGCGVDPANFDHVGAVTAGGATSVVTVTGANSQPDGFWTGGYATPTTGSPDFRLILAHSGNNLTLLLPFAVDVSGLNLQIFAGCNHQLTGDCAVKFQNAIEFGGFAFVPNKNLFQTGLN